MDKRHWSGLSYLDAIRPQPGWSVDRAILATYSADLVAVVATLLALAGLDDDRGSGSKVDFANAFEQLRDRVKILVQAGRLGWPNKKTPILAILDRFIVEINADERERSWHPKAALVKMIKEDKPDIVEWRLWISSRNLTRSIDWDAGLLLTGRLEGSGQSIPGIAHLADEFAQLARLTNFDREAVRQEIEQVYWQSPEGTLLHDLNLLMPDHRPGLPAKLDKLRKLFVISPFIDGTIISRLGGWANQNTETYLLSTQAELARLHGQAGQPLKAFNHILALDAPEEGEAALSESPEPEQDAGSGEDEEIETRGLHAKLVYAETTADERVLWLGSANATGRGWRGPNTEIIARLTIIDESIAAGLKAFLELARPVDLASLTEGEETDPQKEQLEKARNAVAAQWQVTQKRHDRGPVLVAEVLPHPEDEAIQLEVGLLACDLVVWPHQQQQLQLPSISKAQETELVQIRLSLGGYQEMWLQRAPLDPPPDEERDRRALARHLDPRTFLLWIRALLNMADVGDGGGDWDVETTASRQQLASGLLEWWAPTLEEVLKAWTRNPDNLGVIDRKVQHYLKLMQEKDRIEQNPETQKVLDEFADTWAVLREVLVEEKV
jgi:hypothetical protein